MNEKECAEKESEKAEIAAEQKRVQNERSYYYDDAHGYEIYNPDDEDDEDED